MAENPGNPQPDVVETGIISRPLAVLEELPVEYRWEFTRRHPYYLLFWENAHKHLQNPSSEREQRKLGEAAVLMLTVIGVTGDPPAPSASLQELEITGLSKAWQKGAVWPITFRGLTGMMLKELPPASRATIGRLLVESAGNNSSETPELYRLFSEFLQFRDPSLDKMPNSAIIGVNVNAPIRTIVDAVEQRVREWKDQLKIPEHRRRDEKLPEYLKVWDLREGWVGDHYDVRCEKTLQAIAEELSESLPTVTNRYRSAFRYLIGHDYRPAIWARVLGAFKMSRIVNPDHTPRLTGQRPWKSPGLRVVSETTLLGRRQPTEGHGGTFIENMAVMGDMFESADLVMDVQTLLEEGYSNERIAKELEIDPSMVADLLAFLRQRHEDGI